MAKKEDLIVLKAHFGTLFGSRKIAIFILLIEKFPINELSIRRKKNFFFVYFFLDRKKSYIADGLFIYLFIYFHLRFIKTIRTERRA